MCMQSCMKLIVNTLVIACKSTWKHLVSLSIQCIRYCQACKFLKFCKSFQCFKSLQLANYQSAACKGGRRQGRSLKIICYRCGISYDIDTLKLKAPYAFNI